MDKREARRKPTACRKQEWPPKRRRLERKPARGFRGGKRKRPTDRSSVDDGAKQHGMRAKTPQSRKRQPSHHQNHDASEQSDDDARCEPPNSIHCTARPYPPKLPNSMPSQSQMLVRIPIRQQTHLPKCQLHDPPTGGLLRFTALHCFPFPPSLPDPPFEYPVPPCSFPFSSRK